ncbi:hypothetical protein Acidovoranil_14440 [Acidovorax sp. FG27]
MSASAVVYARLRKIFRKLRAIWKTSDLVHATSQLVEINLRHHHFCEILKQDDFFRAQGPWLTVDDAEAAESVTSWKQQGRARVEPDMRRASHEFAPREARIFVSVFHYEDV